jgi:hypothetical protein
VRLNKIGGSGFSCNILIAFPLASVAWTSAKRSLSDGSLQSFEEVHCSQRSPSLHPDVKDNLVFVLIDAVLKVFDLLGLMLSQKLVQLIIVESDIT